MVNETSTRTDASVEVRRAVAEDLPILREIYPSPELALPDRRFTEQQSGTGILGVAIIGGRIVAVGFLDFIDEELNPELKNLWVVPEARRTGVGSTLWRWLEEQAGEAGHQQVYLAVDPNNSRAIPFFLELGYSPTGDHLFVESPEVHQVNDPSEASHHYAIYRKSLLAG